MDSTDAYIFKTYGLGVMDAKADPRWDKNREIRFIFRNHSTKIDDVQAQFASKYNGPVDVSIKYCVGRLYSSRRPLEWEARAIKDGWVDGGYDVWMNIRNDDIFIHRCLMGLASATGFLTIPQYYYGEGPPVYRRQAMRLKKSPPGDEVQCVSVSDWGRAHLAGKLDQFGRDRLTPLEVANKLDGYADAVDAALPNLQSQIHDNVELSDLLWDLESMALLGRYYADKQRCAAKYWVYRESGFADKYKNLHDEAIAHIRDAQGHWEAVLHDGSVEIVAVDEYDALEKDGLIFAINAAEFNKIWKHGAFNTQKVRCIGSEPKITTWINGVKIMEMAGRTYRARELQATWEKQWDNPSAWDAEKVREITGNKGHIALQLHPGHRWKVGGVV